MYPTSNATTELFDKVVNGGYCIGCGACAAFDNHIRIKLDVCGRFVATRLSDKISICPAAARVCPFADGVPNENELAHEVFVQADSFDPHLGFHVGTYAGWVLESDFRASGSSGGLASWLLVEMLDRGLVDYVVHVSPEPDPSSGIPLFRYAVSSTPGEVRARSKSRYYPVEMSGVIGEMLQYSGRYVVVGIPCFIKALRLACRESAILKDRLTFTVGIVCGHLKSTAFAEIFAWQCGITPDELRTIDFRTKLPNRPASDYAVTVSGERAGRTITVTRPTSELFGSNWGHGLFKYKACDFCDDVVAETADISIGDAWLPEYEGDSGGTNIVVVRSQVLNSLLQSAASKGRLHLDTIPVNKVVESQAGGFRHRREGLAYRLMMQEETGVWRPTKRVKPSACHLTSRQQKIYAMRHQIGQASHAAYATALNKRDYGAFLRTMKPLVLGYDRLYRRPLLVRILGYIKQSIAFIFITNSKPK